MERSVRRSIRRVLERIPDRRWKRLLRSGELGERLEAIRQALHHARSRSDGGSPSELMIDLLGTRILSDRDFGPWIREQILRTLPVRSWRRLVSTYRDTDRAWEHPLHGNSVQDGAGSRVMSEYWRRGGRWAKAFCDEVGLPAVLARSSEDVLPDDEDIIPAEPLPPLHDFQLEVYAKFGELIGTASGRTALLSLPTGAGKTRVAVEAVCDHFATASARELQRHNIVLWISLSSELQMQAWECFRQVWQVPPARAGRKAPISRPQTLRLIRAWGGRDPEEIEVNSEPTVLVAGIDQLASWAKRYPEWFRRFPADRLACVIVDEAHSLITQEHARVLVALGLRRRGRWRSVRGAAPVVGLSATPWRTQDEETRRLLRFFKRRLLRPRRLGPKPVKALQRRGILSGVRAKRIRFGGARELWEADERFQEKFDKFHEIPPDFLKQLGLDPVRNGMILSRLRKLPKRRKVIVFACSVQHAELLSASLNRIFRRSCAAALTAETPRHERLRTISRFRDGDLRFLVNVSVLALGFDAPRADVVFVARPTASAIRYEQMVGRGLRGPKNGGTRSCLVIDMQDEGLPNDIQSYARVIALWDGPR